MEPLPVFGDEGVWEEHVLRVGGRSLRDREHRDAERPGEDLRPLQLEGRHPQADHLRGGSPPAGLAAGNTLKTCITEREVLIERKGQEAERLPNCCAFLFTSNHLPLWIEKDDRRYYLVEIDHDGHAAGPRAEEFAALVERVRELIQNPEALAGIYRALLQRQLQPGFSAKTLNIVEDATPLMKRVHGASELTARAQLREHLNAIGAHALPESDVTRVLREHLRINMNATKHLMTELGWSKQMAKSGSRDYRRAIWIRAEFWAEGGKLRGPDGFEQDLVEHLETLDRRAMEELQ